MKPMEKALNNIKLAKAYLLGRGVDDSIVPWSEQLEEAEAILEKISVDMESPSSTDIQSPGCLVDQVIGKLEQAKANMQNTKLSYIAYIDPKYVSEVRYCAADDADSVDESEWREDLHRPIFLGVVSGKCKDELIKEAASLANISTKAVQLIPIGGVVK